MYRGRPKSFVSSKFVEEMRKVSKSVLKGPVVSHWIKKLYKKESFKIDALQML